MIKVGDMIYFRNFSSLYDRQPVIRITPTMIKTESYNLKGDEDYLRVLGQGKWSTMSAQVETEQLKKEWRAVELRRWIVNNWQHLTLEEIEELKNKREK